MSFNSPIFFCFLFLAFAVYFSVPQNKQWKVLLISSYVYYAYSSMKALVFIVFTTVVTFYASIWLEKINQKYKSKINIAGEDKILKKELQSRCISQKKKIIAITAVLNFGILVFIKYGNFIVENINVVLSRFSVVSEIHSLNLLIPLGISFYMFQSVGYVIDVYRSKIEAEHSLLKYSLFVSFFPQIVQGPISRYSELAHQLYMPHKWNFDNVKYGIQLMLWGFFKKLAIADVIVVWITTVYNDYTQYGGAIVFTATVLYGFQVYCDFSGGIDITRGIAQILGIYLPENFQRPYFAHSVADFWRRWHKTLGAWMREYLFYPLVLSQRFMKLGRFTRKRIKGHIGKVLPTCIATTIVFIIVGMWHGASWKYIAYGVWNSIFITGGTMFMPTITRICNKLHINMDGISWKIFQILFTNFIVGFSRYFSRAANLSTALNMIWHTFAGVNGKQLIDGTIFQLGLSKYLIMFVALETLILFFVSLLQEKGYEIRKELEQQNPFLQWIVLFVGLCIILYFGVFAKGYTSSEFIYMKF